MVYEHVPEKLLTVSKLLVTCMKTGEDKAGQESIATLSKGIFEDIKTVEKVVSLRTRWMVASLVDKQRSAMRTRVAIIMPMSLPISYSLPCGNAKYLYHCLVNVIPIFSDSCDLFD